MNMNIKQEQPSDTQTQASHIMRANGVHENNNNNKKLIKKFHSNNNNYCYLQKKKHNKYIFYLR